MDRLIVGRTGVASTPHTLYLILTATPTSSPRLPDIPSLPSPPSPLLHLFYPKKRLWMFRWMIHGLDRWLMDALSSVRSPYSHLPEERVKSRHFTLGLIIKYNCREENIVSPLHHDRIPHAGAPDVDRASCLRAVVDKEQRTRSWQDRTNTENSRCWRAKQAAGGIIPHSR